MKKRKLFQVTINRLQNVKISFFSYNLSMRIRIRIGLPLIPVRRSYRKRLNKNREDMG
jgi:hypothetical protein